MADIINKARTRQRSLVITLLDLKNAFAEGRYNLIQTALDYHHIPDHIKSLVKSLYIDFRTSILTNEFRTPFIMLLVVVYSKVVPIIQSKCLSVLELTVGFESNLNNNAVRKKEKYVNLINEMSGN